MHTYGPSQHDRPEFAAADYPSNMPAIWSYHWGRVPNTTGRPVVLGEWGGDQTKPGQQAWYDALFAYMSQAGLRDNFFWCVNSDSGTTGLLVDWKTPDQAKLDMLAKLQPDPTQFRQALGMMPWRK